MMVIDVRNVAKKFINDHYPEYFSWFDMTWDVIAKRMGKVPKGKFDSDYIVSALKFARSGDLKFRMVLKVIVTFNQLSTNSKLEVDNFENEVLSTCEDCKVFSPLKDKISEAFRSYFLGAEEQVVKGETVPTGDIIEVEVSFSKDNKYVKFHNRDPIPIKLTQEFLLLEELIVKQEIHWTRGFTLFKRWQKKVPEKGSIEQFMVVVSRLNKKIKFRLVVRSENKKQTWELNHNIILKSSIDKAKRICHEAEEKLIDSNQVIRKLQEALDYYPASLETNKIFLESLINNKERLGENEIGTAVSQAKHLFLNKEDDIKAAIRQIRNNGKQDKWQKLWKDALPYLDGMIRELEDIEFYKAIATKLWDGIIPNKAKTRVSLLMDDISKIASGNTDIFETFKDRSMIKEVRRIVVGIVLRKIKDKSYNYVDVDRFVISILFKETKSICQKNFDTDKKLKSYLVEMLIKKAPETIICDKYSIKKNKQDDIWKMAKVRNELREKFGIYPTNEQLLKELGPAWDLGRLREILTYEEQMSGFIDIEEEWKYRKIDKDR